MREPGRQIGKIDGLVRDRHAEYGRGIGTERHEADMTEREHTGEAVEQVQAHDQHDVDTENHDYPMLVGAGAVVGKQRQRREQHHRQGAACPGSPVE